MTELTGMTPQELSDWCKAQGMPAFRGKQIFRWIHQGADFDAMTNLPAAMRAQHALCLEVAAAAEAREGAAQAHELARALDAARATIAGLRTMREEWSTWQR